MICVVCCEDLSTLVDGQYAHARCQKVPGWNPSVSALDFAVDEALATGGVSEQTHDAMRGEIARDFDAAVAKLEPRT